ncbi:hypothetical protein RF11_03782 [Thelohanellus kitauei]|uniref:Uncharacterized protein n=1 Tax=Thelohanellus kitauei TaxID=669202 RepID=A0A0C2MXH1_THEKT|nr:hypothetical protein RF11_03782 [Thelohanellus kitauei]
MIEIEELIQDPENAELYYCPRRITNNCRCLEEFVMKHSWMNENLGTPKDALKLLKGLRREAIELSHGRCTRSSRKIMIYDDGRLKCRGQAKARLNKYIQFLIETSRKLRSHGICAAAEKQILKYSYNLINNKLKYDCDNRNDLIADETIDYNRRKNLMPFEVLMKKRCCRDKCTNKLKKDVTYYSKLRSDAKTSHKLKRKAITKLLMTPSGGIPNCNNFIVLLLGVSRNTIKSVKNVLILGSKGVKKQESKKTYERSEDTSQSLDTLMPVQASNTHHQTTDAVNNFQQVNHIPQDMGQSFVSFQNTEVPTTPTQSMSDPVNSFAEFNANCYSLLDPEQFQTTDLTNQNMSMQGCTNSANASHEFYVPNEGVASASHNLNSSYIEYTEQNVGNNILSTYNNNLPLQQNTTIDPTNQNMVNDFSYQYLPTYPVNMNRTFTIYQSPSLYWNGVPKTSHAPSTFG